MLDGERVRSSSHCTTSSFCARQKLPQCKKSKTLEHDAKFKRCRESSYFLHTPRTNGHPAKPSTRMDTMTLAHTLHIPARRIDEHSARLEQPKPVQQQSALQQRQRTQPLGAQHAPLKGGPPPLLELGNVPKRAVVRALGVDQHLCACMIENWRQS